MHAAYSPYTSSIAIAAAVATAFSLVILHKRELKKLLPFPQKRTPLKRVALDDLPKLKNDLVIRALRGKPTERVPVWCMRQAGRHLPEFRALRDIGYDFFTMCTVPELAVEVSLQPLRRYNLDAVIIFSDILVIPLAMGMEVSMVSGVGPVIAQPIRDPSDVDKLDLAPDIESTLGYLLDALNLARQKIRGEVPLIGFCGGPLTLLCYIIEGRGSKTKSLFKAFLYEHPQTSHKLLYAITDICVRLLIAEYQAGAQVLQVFESVAGEAVTQAHYYEFSLPYLEQIAARVKDACGPTIPIVCFSKGTPYAIQALGKTQYDALQLDWQTDPRQVRELLDNTVALQGNLDPSVLYASPQTIRTQVRLMLEAFGTQRYVANLGHGCNPDMNPIHVDTFVKAVQQLSLDINT